MAAISECKVRQGRREDIPEILALLHEAMWYRTMEDVTFLFDNYPQGIFVAENSEGEVISHCAAIQLDEKTGSVAFYVTKKAWRGRGIGRKVFETCFLTLGDRLVFLNAVQDLQALYASIGFRIATFYFTIYELLLRKNLNIKKDYSPCPLVHLAEVDFQKIVTYDEKLISRKRKKILKWCVEFAHVGLVAMDTEGKVKGWGAMVKSTVGYRLMPLYADTLETAKCIAAELLERVHGDGISEAVVEIAIHEGNREMQKLLRWLGLREGYGSRCRRMYTEHDIPSQDQFVFSLMNTDYEII